jgi:hypothetical protein
MHLSKRPITQSSGNFEKLNGWIKDKNESFLTVPNG